MTVKTDYQMEKFFHRLKYRIEEYFDRLGYRISQYFYYLRCKWWSRYNTVVCKEIPPTWCDRDFLLLHSCFQILVDFIEKEEPEVLTRSARETYYHYKKMGIERAVQEVRDKAKMRELYKWYKSSMAKDSEDDSISLDSYEDDTEKLVELVKLRVNFWT